MNRSNPGDCTRKKRVESSPPRLAEFVLGLTLRSRYRDQQLGDLREEFVSLQSRVSRTEAKRWYRRQVLKSIVPNLRCSVKCRERLRNDRRNKRANMGEAFAQDLAFTFRSARRRPAFYSVILLVFALGIGANTVIFSVVNGVLLRPLPFPEPDRLVVPWQTAPSWIASPNPALRASGHRFSLSYPVYLDWLEENRIFESLGVHSGSRGTYLATWAGQTERVRGTEVTHGVFAALEVPPTLGRVFSRDDDQPGAPSLAVLSHGFWQRRFGSDSSIVGRSIVLNEQPHTIIGVMPAGFDFPGSMEVWTTFDHSNPDLVHRDANMVVPIARLRAGVSIGRAQSEMEILAEHLKEINPIPGRDYGVNIVYLRDDVVRNVRSALLLLLCTTGIFLAIACANIANLLLVRASERRKELAVRSSLGASRGRIYRQLLTEGLALSVVGGAVGCLAAVVCTGPFVAVLPSDTPRVGEIGVDLGVLICSAALTVATGVLVAVLPAFGANRSRLCSVFQETSRGSAGSIRDNRTQAWILVFEIALTFVLLVGAGLVTRSLIRLTSVERGFNADGIVALDLDMRGSRYATRQQQRAAFEELYQHLRAIPGVTDHAATRAGPFLTRWSNSIIVEAPTGQEYTSTQQDYVSASYFRTMGIPLLAGRSFLPDERFDTSRVVVVNELLARTYWPDESPVGKRMRFGERIDTESPWHTIVGVVGNVRSRLDAEPHIAVYRPVYYGNPTVVLKTEIDPSQVMDAVRAAVRAVDDAVPIVALRKLEQTISASVAGPRVRAILLGSLAVLAATMAVVGIFGVLAYAVAQRTSEIGIRMALGAESANVVRGVMVQGLKLLGTGIAVGIAVSMVVNRALERFLFEVDPADPATLFAVASLLTVAALGASYLPARRAAMVDPVEALRRE